MGETDRREEAEVPEEGTGAAAMDAAAFARAAKDEEGGESGLAGGEGDLGAGGDLAGDFGGMRDDDEGTPV